MTGQTTITTNGNKASLPVVILLTGLVVGALDIIAAFIHGWLRAEVPADRILRYISSAVYGPAAFSGGNAMVIAGLLFHFTIALAFTGMIFLMYRMSWRVLGNKWLIGILNGGVIWLVMNKIILPLTNLPRPKNPDALQQLISLFILISMIGISATLIAHRTLITSRREN